jgi:hypothetical protein
MSTKTEQRPWVNKIVGYADESPEQLLASPFNYRIHPKAQQDALDGVISDVGFIDPVIVNEVTQHVINGHLRVSMAIRRGEKTIPVAYVHLTEAEEKEALLTFDPLSAMAAADKEKLDALLRDVATGSEAVQAMLAELGAKAGLYPIDPTAEWQGMPEFEQEDKTAFQSIHVHFKTQADVEAFAELIVQKIGPKTRALWYPEAEQLDLSSELYRDES